MSNETYGLSTIDHNELTAIETGIRAEFEKVEKTQRDAFIAMGGMLDDARKLINDDHLFGEWRKQRTPFESKENANKAMLLHRAIQDGTITPKMLSSKMGQSHLLELKDAPLSVQNDVEILLDSGNVPSVKNLREMKKLAAASSEGSKESGQQDGASTNKGTSTTTSTSSDPYQEKEPAIARSKKDQYGDILGRIDQILDEEIMPLTIEAHGLANKQLNDNQRSTQVNDLRASLKDLMKGLDQMIQFNEGRD